MTELTSNQIIREYNGPNGERETPAHLSPKEERKRLILWTRHFGGPGAAASYLGCNSAHISNVIGGNRKVGPTLRKAMIDAGWLPARPPYPYLKINREDPSSAAQSILKNQGSTWTADLADRIDFELGEEGTALILTPGTPPNIAAARIFKRFGPDLSLDVAEELIKFSKKSRDSGEK